MPFAIGAVTIDSGTVLVLIAVVAIPFAAFSFSRVGEVYGSIGKGGFGMERDQPAAGRHPGPPASVDPAIQAAEVRQMLEAKASRLRRRGEAAIDVETEAARLLAGAQTPNAEARMDAELRAEVRQLVITRNERRMHKGLEPLDVEAETERQLEDFIGSRP
jgi:hypothetical protein